MVAHIMSLSADVPFETPSGVLYWLGHHGERIYTDMQVCFPQPSKHPHMACAAHVRGIFQLCKLLSLLLRHTCLVVMCMFHSWYRRSNTAG